MNQTTIILLSMVLVLLAINIGFIFIDATIQQDYNIKIDKVIKEGLNECSEFKNDNCISVISTLDQICQVAYFPNCFGDQWSNFEQYFKSMIQQGHYPDERYKDDPYFTLNNHHYGSE